jgi:hypothetical protein
MFHIKVPLLSKKLPQQINIEMISVAIFRIFRLICYFFFSSFLFFDCFADCSLSFLPPLANLSSENGAGQGDRDAMVKFVRGNPRI